MWTITRRASTAASPICRSASTPERSSASRVSTATARPSWPSAHHRRHRPGERHWPSSRVTASPSSTRTVFIEHGVSHVPEDRNLQGLIGDMSIAENLVLKRHRRSALQPRSWFAPEQARHPRLRAVHDGKNDVRATSDSQSVRELSGGNQQKVIIARELESGPSVLVMACILRAASTSARPALSTTR